MTDQPVPVTPGRDLAAAREDHERRKQLEQFIDERLKGFAERFAQSFAEWRAQLHNEIAASEARSAYHAERRDEKLEAATVDLLMDFERRLGALEQVVDVERRLAALEQRAAPLQLQPTRPRLIAGRGGDDAA